MTRTELEELNRHMAAALREFLRDNGHSNLGFTLFVFGVDDNPGPPADDDFISYASTANRQDMIKTIKWWLEHVEAGVTTAPLGPKVKG